MEAKCPDLRRRKAVKPSESFPFERAGENALSGAQRSEG